MERFQAQIHQASIQLQLLGPTPADARPEKKLINKSQRTSQR